MRFLHPTSILAVFLLCCPAVFAQARVSYASKLVGARAELVLELEELASWCFRKKLFQEADTTYRQILELDENHASARKGLRFRLRRGVWVQSAAYRQPRNLSQDPLADLAAKRLDVLGGYKSRMFQWNEEHAGDTSLEIREQTLEHMLRLMPEDAEVRASLGEALVDGEWALLETSNARSRRKWIIALARTCLSTAPLGDPAKANPLESALQLRWSSILSTPYLRVAGTGEPAEVQNVLRASHGAGEFFRTLLDNDTLPPVGFAIYLLSRSGEKRQFLDKHPGIKVRDRAYLESLVSAGIPKTAQTVEWSRTPVERLDRSVRQTFGRMLTDTFELTTDDGWAWEGIGIYLTYRLVGTRLTYYIRPNRYGGDASASITQKQLFKRLYTPESNWLDEARLHFAERRPPRLNFLMGRKVDSMSAQDLLWSYVFAAFLIEGRPDKTPRFLSQIGAGKRPHDAVRSVFQMELPRFEERVMRWLMESR